MHVSHHHTQDRRTDSGKMPKIGEEVLFFLPPEKEVDLEVFPSFGKGSRLRSIKQTSFHHLSCPQFHPNMEEPYEPNNIDVQEETSEDDVSFWTQEILDLLEFPEINPELDTEQEQEQKQEPAEDQKRAAEEYDNSIWTQNVFDEVDRIVEDSIWTQDAFMKIDQVVEEWCNTKKTAPKPTKQPPVVNPYAGIRSKKWENTIVRVVDNHKCFQNWEPGLVKRWIYQDCRGKEWKLTDDTDDEFGLPNEQMVWVCSESLQRREVETKKEKKRRDWIKWQAIRKNWRASAIRKGIELPPRLAKYPPSRNTSSRISYKQTTIYLPKIPDSPKIPGT